MSDTGGERVVGGGGGGTAGHPGGGEGVVVVRCGCVCLSSGPGGLHVGQCGVSNYGSLSIYGPYNV